MEVLRLCVAEVAEIMALDKNYPRGVTNIRPQFVGDFGFLANFLVEELLVYDVNFTIVQESIFGKGGCQTSIANNESDFGIAMVDYPVDEEYEKVNPFITLFEEPLVILQGYNRTTHDTKFADIIQQSMKSFSMTIWTLLVVLTFFFGLLFKIRQYTENWKPRKRRLLLSRPGVEYFPRRKKKPGNSSDPFFQVMSLFMQTDVEDYDDAYRRILSLILSIGSFVVITGYFCNLMSTEMVTVEKPVVIESYEDIIAKQSLIPLFVKTLTDYEHFRDADEGSVEKRFWTIMTTERSSENKVLLNVEGMETMLSKMIDGAFGYHVLIISKMCSEFLRSTACILKEKLKMFPNILTWTSKDPESPNYQKGILIRQTEMKVVRQAIRRGRFVAEAGFVVRMRNLIDEVLLIPTELKFGDTSIPTDMRDCASSTLVMDKPGYQAAHLGNFKVFAITCLSLLLMSLALLLFEIVQKKIST